MSDCSLFHLRAGKLARGILGVLQHNHLSNGHRNRTSDVMEHPAEALPFCLPEGACCLVLMPLSGTLAAIAVTGTAAVPATVSMSMSMRLVRALVAVAIAWASTKLTFVTNSVMLVNF
jgi:hypothetical protein